MWLVAGFVLVIAELMTGTFYLLVIGVGAFFAAIVAWLGGNELVQGVAGSAVALGGAWYVHHWHVAHDRGGGGRGNFLDFGQPVLLESWTNEGAGIARVKYRGASWEARLAEPAARP